jgi:CheY-like chemotaxis protein
MKPISEPSLRVAIVDPTPQDYLGLLSSAGRAGESIHFFSSGNDALRFSRRMPSVFWVINTELHDMSGFDLATMLRSVRPTAHVFIIGDSYCLDDEIQALTLGLAKYVCKPLEPSWIFPQDQDFCIPMSGKSNLRPLSTFGDSASESEEFPPVIFSLPEQRGLEAEDQVILPFQQPIARMPWHKDSA